MWPTLWRGGRDAKSQKHWALPSPNISPTCVPSQHRTFRFCCCLCFGFRCFFFLSNLGGLTLTKGLHRGPGSQGSKGGFCFANWAFPYHYHTFSYPLYSLVCICPLMGISLSLPQQFLYSVLFSLNLLHCGHFLSVPSYVLRCKLQICLLVGIMTLHFLTYSNLCACIFILVFQQTIS